MPPMSQIAWVAGATGYTGRALVAALRAQGVTTHAHVRPDSPALERWRTQFTALGAVVETTPWELAPLTAALRGCAATQVYGLLGTTRARARAAERSGAAPADYERVDVGLTLMLLAAVCSAAGNRPRFVYLSATGVRGPADGNAYMRASRRVEAAVRSSGLPGHERRRRAPSGATRRGRDR
jgi:nucleoside-diphosphate-sugar epimerase